MGNQAEPITSETKKVKENDDTHENVSEITKSSELTESLKKCEQETAEWKDKYLRAWADFQNYKKRHEKEQAAFKRMIKGDLLREMLSIVDNFDRAIEAQEQIESVQACLEGFELIRKDLYKFLQKHGVKEIEAYETFDPELHEAVMQVEADDHEPGDIVEVLQKGYLLNNIVLRPAKVSVAK